MPTLAENLQRILEDSGLSQKWLANETGMHPGDVSRYVSGRTPDPGWSAVVRLARALKVSLDQLAGEEPKSTLTAYDKSDAYQELVALLERIPRRDRTRALEALTWLLEPRSKPSSSSRHVAVAPPESASPDSQQLAESIMRMPRDQQQVFFQSLADRGAFEATQLERIHPHTRKK